MIRKIFCIFLAVVMAVIIIPFSGKNSYAADNVPWSDLLLDAEKWLNSSCDITIESEQQIHVKSDLAGDEEYTLLEKPDSNSALVEGQKKQVLQAVPLDIFMYHTEDCVELIHILRNAVNGIGISSVLTKLNDSFSGTIDTTLVFLSSFKSGSDVTINDIIQAYKYSTNPSYVNTNTNGVEMANKTFSKIQTRYDSLANQADNLIGRYESNEEILNKIFNKIIDERDLDVKKKNEVLSEMDGIAKKIDHLKEQKSALSDKINEYSKQYTDFSYQLPGQEQLVTKTAAISSIYGGCASLFGLPKDDVAIILEEQKAIQETYTDIMREMVSVVDKIANSSSSTRDIDVVINASIATRCCMKLIEVNLYDFSIFCENVSKSCQNMIDRSTAVAQAYPYSDEVSYIDAFKDEKYIEAYLLYIVNLTALNKLSIEALDAFHESRENNLNYEKEEETVPKVHFERVRNSASTLSAKIKEQSLYNGTVINEKSSGNMAVMAACGVMILCGGVIALIAAKKKKKRALANNIDKESKDKE